MPVRCWSTIGVQGDATCEELRAHVHCRNCPVYAQAATALLDAPIPDSYVAEWSSHLAQPVAAEQRRARAALLVRVAGEWLAMPPSLVAEVMPLAPLHSIPHRRRDLLLGLANVRGELIVCVSLGQVLGIGAVEAAGTTPARGGLLVLRQAAFRAACPVDEVFGVHRFHDHDVHPLPATMAHATKRFATGLLIWTERSVGLLDETALVAALRRSIA